MSGSTPVLFSWPFPHDCCLMMSQCLLQAGKTRPREGVVLTSHWLNLSHMAVSTFKGGWEIECSTSPIAVVHPGIREIRALLQRLPQRRQNGYFSKANTGSL